MMVAKRIDVPEGLFGDDTAEPVTHTRRKRSGAVTKSPSLEAFLGRARDPETGKLIPKKKRARTRSVAASTHDRTRAETQRMIDTRDWEGCAPRHLVALYDLMHRKTYGIDAPMTGTERHRATLMAGGFVKRAFGGDMDKALHYLRWLWTREMDREKWRRENGRDGGRLELRWIFGNRLLTDYQVAMARKR